MTIKDRSRLDDFYSQKARKLGYPARSVFKLAEFDQKMSLFKPGQIVLDLGCAPGSWTKYVAEKVGSKGLVVGVDLTVPPGQWPNWVKLVAADLLEGPKTLLALSQNLATKVDAVLSDLAPKTTGRPEVDQAQSLELVLRAWELAQAFLKEGGLFLFKVFQSPAADEFVVSLKKSFRGLKRLKPKASRSASQEIFVLTTGFLANKGR
ncbi:MAG: RlmE family RNA methyltransferase [Deltaproteobacteria bacterium]|jgi:23S rRNA (uridine2552-2'-O)-methyltransferase|nr:RlmE family RNA methyltransferase [Deltaproteobacteria bacterium]